MAEENGSGELDVTAPGGFGFRSKGYRVMDLVCLLTAAGMVAGAYYVRGYAAEYENNAKGIRESSDKVVKAVEEASKQNTDVIKQMALEHRRSNDIMQEMACLLDPALKNRNDARDVCKRLVRSDREIR